MRTVQFPAGRNLPAQAVWRQSTNVLRAIGKKVPIVLAISQSGRVVPVVVEWSFSRASDSEDGSERTGTGWHLDLRFH
jgi:hypothetical protein